MMMLVHLFVSEKESRIDYQVNATKGLPFHQFEMSVNAKDDYVEENKELLIDWLKQYDGFPLTAYVAAYEEMYQDIDVLLMEWEITYEKVSKATEKQPVYIIHLENIEQLTQVVSAFYWLPAQNEIMLLTDCKETVELTERKVSPKSSYTRLWAEIHLPSKNCSVITIQHDGQGIGVVTTVESLNSAEGIHKSIPKGYVIQQWGEEVLIPFE